MAAKWKKKEFTVEEVCEILASVAKKHHTKKVIFVTDSTDGIVRESNTIEVNIVNDGHMGYGDWGLYIYHAGSLLHRPADYYVLNSKTSKKDLKSLGGIVVYEKAEVQ